MNLRKKVLVAGATGTLGVPLIRELVAKGYEVTGLTRSPSKRTLVEEAGAAAVVVDALDPRALENALRSASPEWVVHLLTAIPKNGPTRYVDMVPTNTLRIKGTENLLRAAVAAGATRIVGESMIFTYGFGDHGQTPKTESDSLQPREANRGLQAIVDALRSLEDQFLAATRQGQIEAIPLRYGLFYGLESPSTHFMLSMVRRRLFPVPAKTEGLCSWINVEDAVSGTLAALEAGKGGEIYNLVDDWPVSIGEWVKYAAQLLNAKPPLAVPLWLLKWTMPYVAQFTTARLPVSNAKAKRELGWQPRYLSYQEGLKAIAARLNGE